MTFWQRNRLLRIAIALTLLVGWGGMMVWVVGFHHHHSDDPGAETCPYRILLQNAFELPLILGVLLVILPISLFVHPLQHPPLLRAIGVRAVRAPPRYLLAG